MGTTRVIALLILVATADYILSKYISPFYHAFGISDQILETARNPLHIRRTGVIGMHRTYAIPPWYRTEYTDLLRPDAYWAPP